MSFLHLKSNYSIIKYCFELQVASHYVCEACHEHFFVNTNCLILLSA